jgi:hypothetical protein
VTILRVRNPWAYSTEFEWWALTSAIHAGLLWVVFGLWLAGSNPILAAEKRRGRRESELLEARTR